ncbi:MAG: type II toxin-antitoxin system VapC family toxin [Gammaproteobacteria bacterium]
MIFIDTGAFIARYIQADQHHKKAQQLWKKLEKSKEKLMTSNFVLDETFTLMARKSHYSFALETANIIYSSSIFSIVRPDAEVELNALKFFEKFSDQKVSYTDCISFQLMRDHHVKKVFTFDRHFQLLGFEAL